MNHTIRCHLNSNKIDGSLSLARSFVRPVFSCPLSRTHTHTGKVSIFLQRSRSRLTLINMQIIFQISPNLESMQRKTEHAQSCLHVGVLAVDRI